MLTFVFFSSHSETINRFKHLADETIVSCLDICSPRDYEKLNILLENLSISKLRLKWSFSGQIVSDEQIFQA